MPDDRCRYEIANQAKACFDEVYDAPDPRAYFTALGRLDYQIPSQAKPVFRAVMRAMGRDRIDVLDIGCSYGVNAALLRYDLEFETLVDRYDRPEMAQRSTAEVILDDAAHFAGLREETPMRFVGLDVAAEAAGYAKAVGLIDAAVVANLEDRPLTEAEAALVEGADLIITTGAIGYVTRRTFARLLDARRGAPPWVAAFALRQYPFDEIAEALAARALDTATLEDRLFPQRAFQDAEEAEGAIAAVRAAGRDPEGVETRGGYFAEFHLAAPEAAKVMARIAA